MYGLMKAGAEDDEDLLAHTTAANPDWALDNHLRYALAYYAKAGARHPAAAEATARVKAEMETRGITAQDS